MNTVAMYLPQYHSIPENDIRIYKGFTEWDLVRSAQSLFEGHYQPKIPYRLNYYDLSNVDSIRWQASLANEYGIDAFCFYHYYFGNQNVVMNKPAMILLENKDIKIRFCFCWANETWGNDGNVWTNRFDSGSKMGNIVQEYGNDLEVEWHYKYNKKFFEDDRYLKIDNKPVFVIYKPHDIMILTHMIGLWNDYALQDGFNGIYFVGMNMDEYVEGISANLYHAPNCGFSNNTNIDVVNGVLRKNYEVVWNNILSLQKLEGCKTFYGGFVNFDNTPRYGNNHSLFMSSASVTNFTYYFDRLVKKNIDCGNEMIWINAWNEWGEGNYLEPDMINGFDYLQAVSNVMHKYREE